jgi:hypothetical protein
MSHRTPRESKSTPLLSQSQSASDSASNVALTAVPSRLIVIFREVRFDSQIENKCPSVDTEELCTNHLALVILKSMGLEVMIRRRCQAKTIFGRLIERHETYVPCSVSGTDHTSIFFLLFSAALICGCNDALLSDPLSSVAIPRHGSSTRQLNSRYPHATSQPHETQRQLVTPTRRTGN